jgi:hypothetical protein
LRDNKWLARNTAAQIRREYGLAPTQMVLLSPGDATRKQFSRLAGLWSGYWPAGRQSVGYGRWGMALLGVAVLLLAGWAAAQWSDDQSLFSQSPLLAGLGGLLALGLVAAWLLQRRYTRPHVRRFESRVQQQLAQGHWAVVVCKLPWAQQAGVLQRLRANSFRWCAVAEPSARI